MTQGPVSWRGDKTTLGPEAVLAEYARGKQSNFPSKLVHERHSVRRKSDLADIKKGQGAPIASWVVRETTGEIIGKLEAVGYFSCE